MALLCLFISLQHLNSVKMSQSRDSTRTMKLKIAPIAFNQAPEPTDLLLGLAIVWLQLEDLLEAARRRLLLHLHFRCAQTHTHKHANQYAAWQGVYVAYFTRLWCQQGDGG